MIPPEGSIARWHYEIREQQLRAEDAEEALQRVRDLHKRGLDDDGLFCRHCCEPWPCKTIRVIDMQGDSK